VDDSAAYGDYYQWGRAKDGHQSASILFVVAMMVSAASSPSVGTLKPAGQMSSLPKMCPAVRPFDQFCFKF
jgi:hypothetical protein